MKKNGSILIFVLFMLAVSSLLALLIVEYVKNILNNSSIYYKFEKSYYLAYWWIELELVKIKNHWPGFEDTISWNSETNSKNRLCKNCHFIVKNKSLSNILWWDSFVLENNIASCNNLPENHWIKLKWWEWIIFPLFKSSSISYKENKLVDSVVNPININQINLYYSWNIWDHFILWITNWNNSEIFTGNLITSYWNKSYIPTFSNFNNQTYLWLVRQTSWTTPDSFCLWLNKAIPTDRNYITSEGKYRNFYLVLKSTKLKKVPNYLIYSIIK